MATSGQLTMGEKLVPPMPPRLLIVNVPPTMSSRVSFFWRGTLRYLRHLLADVINALLVHVAQLRHHEAALGIDRDAEVVVVLLDQFAFHGVEAAVELRHLLEDDGTRLEHESGDGELAGPLRFLLFAERLNVGDVGDVVLRDVRDHVPAHAQMVRVALRIDSNGLVVTAPHCSKFGIGGILTPPLPPPPLARARR